MAIERNPCEDEPIVVEEEEEEESGDSGESGGTGEGTTNTPDAVDDPPTMDPTPYPRPFRAQDSDQRAQNQELQQSAEQAPNRRSFATATRQVTVIPNSLFLTSNTDLTKVTKILTRNNSENKNQVNHGKVWFEGRDQEDLDEADLFRWSLDNFWASLGDREGVVYKPMSGHENPHARPTQDPRGRMNSFAIPKTRVIELQTHPDRKHYKLETTTATLMRPGETYETTEIFTEKMRFKFLNPMAVSSRLKSARNQSDRNKISKFLDAYAPSALKFDPNQRNSSQRLDWTRQKVEKRWELFKRMYLFGNRTNKWDSLADLDGWSTGAANYFRKGIINYESGTYGKDWMDFRYKDFVFDAPVAFFEDELNGMLMAPFHSAKITKKVGNVDFVNLKGYDNELEVPNIYHYYNSMELKEDFDEGTINQQSRSEERVAYILGLMTILSRYQSNKKENIFTTRNVLKFPSDRVRELEKTNEFMRAYAENYVEIKINTTQGGQICSLLQNNKMDRILMEVMYPKRIGGSKTVDDLSTKFETKVSMVLDDSFKSSDSEQNSIEKTLNDRTGSDIPITVRTGFYNILKKHLPNSANNEFQKVDRMQYPLFYTGWNNVPLLRLEETIRSQIFCKELEEFIANGKLQRSYADLLSGEKAYSETVGYKVEKHEILEDGEEVLVQTFVLMDSNEIDTINFIDSQVMPFKKYRYKILSINFVLGTDYSYETVRFDSDDVEGFRLDVLSKLGVCLVEAPFFEQVVEIRDMPPMTPQVSFLPTQGIDNQIKILLTMNYGEVKEPWLTRTEEFEKSKALKEKLKTKYGMDKEGMIQWKTDSIPDAYHAMRINVPPENYDYFFKKSLRSEDPEKISMHYRPFNKARLITHDMEPNKYYYYMFRAVDNYRFGDKDWNKENALYSNPTEVFRVRMVSYANGIFLEVEPYEMAQNVKTDNISFERLLKINPNFEQTSIDYSNIFKQLKNTVTIPQNSIEMTRKMEGLLTHEQYIAGHYDFQKSAPNPEELKLGHASEPADSVWSRKFKIRIKSLDSGKAIDLNVKFVQDSDDLEKEE